MYLENTSFFKDARSWREWWISELRTKSKKYWEEYEFDIESYVQKTYVLHLPHRLDRVVKIKNELQNIRTKNSTLLDHVTLWDGLYQTTEWDKNDFTRDYSFNYVFSLDRDPRLIGTWFDANGAGPSIEELENINITSSLAESNIALGHLSILRDIVDNNISHAFVMEDDVVFNFGCSYLLDEAFKQLPEDWDILYASHQPCLNGLESTQYSRDLHKIDKGVWWMSGFFISQRAAKKLLDNLPIVGPVDVWINYQMDDLNVFATLYNYIDQNVGLSSDNTHSYKVKLKETLYRLDLK